MNKFSTGAKYQTRPVSIPDTSGFHGFGPNPPFLLRLLTKPAGHSHIHTETHRPAVEHKYRKNITKGTRDTIFVYRSSASSENLLSVEEATGDHEGLPLRTM